MLESLSLCCEWVTVPAVQWQPWRAPLCRVRWGICPGLLIRFDSRFCSLAWVMQCCQVGLQADWETKPGANRWKRLVCIAGRARDSITLWHTVAGSDSRLSLWHFSNVWQEGDGSIHCSFPQLSEGGSCQGVLTSGAQTSSAVSLTRGMPFLCIFHSRFLFALEQAGLSGCSKPEDHHRATRSLPAACLLWCELTSATSPPALVSRVCFHRALYCLVMYQRMGKSKDLGWSVELLSAAGSTLSPCARSRLQRQSWVSDSAGHPVAHPGSCRLPSHHVKAQGFPQFLTFIACSSLLCKQIKSIWLQAQKHSWCLCGAAVSLS